MMKSLVTLTLISLFLFPACLEKEKENVHQAEASLEAASARQEPRFIHSVYFWLKEGVSEAEKTAFIEKLQGLKEIPSVRRMHIGLPAGTPRDIVDNSYTVAMIQYFDDQEGHDAYQVDSIHQELIRSSRELLEKVKVYDDLVIW